MIESINTEKIQSHETDFSTVAPSRAPEAKDLKYQPEDKTREGNTEVSQAQLDELQRKIESVKSLRIHFSEHEETGRTMVKVIDKETEELIREIPPEDLLNVIAKLDEMIGILFDEKV